LAAVSQATGYPDGIHGDDPATAAREELKQLDASGCDLKILLAHLTRADLDRVLKDAPGFDLAAVAHEGWQGSPQTSTGIPVVYVGQRGRSILRLDLETAGGSEPVVDLGALDRTKQEAESIDRRIQETKKQIASAKDPSAYKLTLQALERRSREIATTQRKEGGYHRRAFRTEAVDLGSGVADDPEVQKAVQAYLAKYPADASDHPPPPGMPPGGRLPAGIFPMPRPGWMPAGSRPQPPGVPPQPSPSPQPGMTQAPRQPLRLAPSVAPAPTGPVP
jgi:2',3'-cyclic-nucleotide 2'-phosphodiesterase (5'-nucleotidase family)